MDRIQLRRDSSARWAEINPILLEGEVGYEIDTKLRKIGDGVHRWNDLEYLRAEGISQETGNSQNITMSQEAITRELSELGSKLFNQTIEYNVVVGEKYGYTETPIIGCDLKKGETICLNVNSKELVKGCSISYRTEDEWVSVGVTDEEVNTLFTHIKVFYLNLKLENFHQMQEQLNLFFQIFHN